MSHPEEEGYRLKAVQRNIDRLAEPHNGHQNVGGQNDRQQRRHPTVGLFLAPIIAEELSEEYLH